MIRTIILCLISAYLLCDQPASSQTTSAAPPATAPSTEDLSRLTMDDLIQRLPLAGDEWRWSYDTQQLILDPASKEMSQRFIRGANLTSDQWQQVLFSTGMIRYHRKWPRSEEYRVSLTLPQWLGLTQIRLKPRFPQFHSISVGLLIDGFCGTPHVSDAIDARQGQPLGMLPDGTTQIHFNVEIERGRSVLDADATRYPPPSILWKGTIALPVELVDGFDQVTQPIDNEQIVEAMRDAIGACFELSGKEQKPVRSLIIDPDTSKYPALLSVALDLNVELLDGDRVITESRLFVSDFDDISLMCSLHQTGKRFFGSTILKVPDHHADTSNWHVRLTGTTEHTLEFWHADKHWNGSIIIPWTQAFEHEAQRTAATSRWPNVSSHPTQ